MILCLIDYFYTECCQGRTHKSFWQHSFKSLSAWRLYLNTLGSVNTLHQYLGWPMYYFLINGDFEIFTYIKPTIQYRHVIPAPLPRTSASDWLYKLLWMACQTQKVKHINDPTKLANQRYVQLWGPPYIHTQESGWRSDVQSCITPGLPTHLVQELNAGTVDLYTQESTPILLAFSEV